MHEIAEQDEARTEARLDVRLLGGRLDDSGELSVVLLWRADPDRVRIREMLLEMLPTGADLHEVTSMESAVKAARSIRPHVLIVDARRDHWPKSELVSQLGYRVAVVYVTDTPGEAQRAFDAGAIDCMVSPFKPERMERALLRALTWTAQNRSASLDISHGSPSADPHADGRRPEYARWLRVVRGEDLLVARCDDIVYMQADRKVTRVILTNSDGYIRTGINAVATQLDSSQFWRIHRSLVVNVQHVEALSHDEFGRLMVRLRGRTDVLYASRPYERALLHDGAF